MSSGLPSEFETVGGKLGTKGISFIDLEGLEFNLFKSKLVSAIKLGEDIFFALLMTNRASGSWGDDKISAFIIN